MCSVVSFLLGYLQVEILMYEVLWERPALKSTLKILRDYFKISDGEHEFLPEQNGNLSWGKPKPNLKGSRAQEE